MSFTKQVYEDACAGESLASICLRRRGHVTSVRNCPLVCVRSIHEASSNKYQFSDSFPTIG